jgi:DNA-binding XRE family transcriptional regulator
MDREKQKRLKAKGWRIGDASEFLELTPEEARYIELKLALSENLKDERLRQSLTQTEFAKLIGSSQSRIAKMEAGDPTVSIDLLLRALLKLGVTKKQLSRMIA